MKLFSAKNQIGPIFSSYTIRFVAFDKSDQINLTVYLSH